MVFWQEIFALPSGISPISFVHMTNVQPLEMFYFPFLPDKNASFTAVRCGTPPVRLPFPAARFHIHFTYGMRNFVVSWEKGMARIWFTYSFVSFMHQKRCIMSNKGGY